MARVIDQFHEGFPYADEEDAFKAWIFTGNCPCCFPWWSFPNSRGYFFDLLDADAWGAYKEIEREYDDD